MPPETRVLVVGTTPDYIEWIRRACPQRCIFITEKTIRRDAEEETPEPVEEICCDLTDINQVRQAVASHQRHWNIPFNGVACFDCESLATAACLAQDLAVDFPSPAAVANCRNKLISKTMWLENGLLAPRVVPVRQADDAVALFKKIGNCVLKPVSGSGSELVFHCRTEDECRRSFSLLDEGLGRRTDNRLYRDISLDSSLMIAEEFIDADEFSCDFLLENSRAIVIRLAEKIPAAATTAFGTTMGYVLVDSLPGVDLSEFARTLARGATTLGLSRAICMADFMVRQGEIFLLEITPRPGGDCLPALIRHALGLDTIMLTLDLAQNRPLPLDPLPSPRPMAGLRVHAAQNGVLKKINWETVAKDPRVKEICPLRRAGDKIRLPPEDYDSFLLGNIIFAPNDKSTVRKECRSLLERLTVEMEP